MNLEEGINVLSVFDGISCGQVALERAGIKVNNYYASELDKHAIKVAQKNYPNTNQLGCVTKVSGYHYPNVNLFIGGSPCQGFSVAGKKLNFSDPRSILFFEYVRILKELTEVNPDIKFLLENVKMKKEWRDIISSFLGVEPIEINSSLVSAQNRKRYYWTNIEGVVQPEDKGIFLKDVVLKDALPLTYTERRTEDAKRIRKEYREKFGVDFSPRRSKEMILREDGKSNCITATLSNKEHLLLSKKALDYMDREVKDGRNHWDFKHHSDVREKKSSAMVANLFKGVPYNVLKDWNVIRKLHPIEVERLQNLPDNYTEGISNTQRYKSLGNGWTVDVIAHIFSFLK